MRALLAALLLLAVPQDPSTKFKFTPDSDKQPNPKKTLEDSAKSIVTRLKVAGYDNVTTTVDEATKILTLAIPKEIAGDERQAIYALGTRPGVLEIRMEKLLGLLEATQFKDPKAPKGCKWYPINQNSPRGARNGGEGARLLIEKPEAYTRKDFGTVVAGGDGTLAWAPTDATVKKISDLAKARDREVFCFCLDGEVIGWLQLDKNWTADALKAIKTSNHDPKSAPLCAILLNNPPLPALLRAKD